MRKRMIYLFLWGGLITPVLASNMPESQKNMDVKQIEILFEREEERTFYDSDPRDELQRIRKMAGQIWIHQKGLFIESVDVTDNAIVITVLRNTQQKEDRIKEFIEKSFYKPEEIEIKYESIDKPVYTETQTFQDFYIADGIPFMACDGKLLPLKHTPYMADGYLMLPIRDICEILSQVTDMEYRFQWIGGKDGLLEIWGGPSGDKVQIYVNTNQYKCRFSQNEKVAFNGQLENKNGTLYIPYTPENVECLFPIWPEYQNTDKRLIRIRG